MAYYHKLFLGSVMNGSASLLIGGDSDSSEVSDTSDDSDDGEGKSTSIGRY
jgi:hypothetical protein